MIPFKSFLAVLTALSLTASAARAADSAVPASSAAGAASAAPARPKPRPAARPARARTDDNSAHNAALPANGGRIALTLAKGVILSKDSGAEMLVDGNLHTRAILTGAPYTIRLDLVDKLPVTEIALCNSDYASELSPKDVEIKLSDGSVITQTLSPDHSTRAAKNRQVVPVNKDISWLEIKVLTNQPGAPTASGKAVNWGGFGEVEVITSADLAKYTAVPGYNPEAPAYVQARYPRADYSGVKVTLPPKIPLGQHPSIYLSRDEFLKLRDTLKTSARGKPLFDDFLALANRAADLKIEFPDPKIPAQIHDRNDPPALAHDRLSDLAGKLGYAYQLTDNEACAQKARDILLGYAQRYPNDYVEHRGINGNDHGKVFSQRLSEAMWLLPLAQAYDCIYNSKCLTAADHKLIDQGLFQTAAVFINGKSDAASALALLAAAGPPRGKVGNWTNFYNAAYVQVGLVTADQAWIDLGAAQTKFNIQYGIGDDGMWAEGAIGYQQFALLALIGCLEPLARQGLDLYSFQNCRVKNMWDSVFSYAYPDASSPGINDSERGEPPNDYRAGVYDYAFLRYGDPAYAPIVNNAPRQIEQSMAVYFPTLLYRPLPVAPNTPPPGLQTSLIFDNLGYAIMRGRDHDAPTYLLLKYSPPSGGHSHPDKLNLILYADGDELAGEPEFYRYEDPRCAGWTKTTIAHFTLAVDQRNQAVTGAKLLAYADAGPVKAMRAQCPTAYPGVLLDRTVVQMPGYVADIFRATSSSDHTYDYPLCFRGSLDALAAVSFDASATMKTLGPAEARGYGRLVVGKTIENSAEAWKGQWQRAAAPAKPAVPAIPAADGKPAVDAVPAVRANPANDVRVTLLGAPGTAIYLCRDTDARDRAVVRRSGTEALFASVINPYQGPSAVASVAPLKVDGPVPAAGLRVKRTDGGQDLIIVRFDPQTAGKLAPDSTFDGGKTNALITVLRLDAAGHLLVPSGYLGGTSAACRQAGEIISTPLVSPLPGILWTK